MSISSSRESIASDPFSPAGLDATGSRGAPSRSATARIRRWIVGWRPALLLAVLALLVWGGTLLNEFAYDDLDVINPRLRLMFYRPWMFITREYFKFSREMSWRPGVTGSYVIDMVVWGRWAPGFHLTNLLLHVGAVLLFWRLVRRTTGSASAGLAGAVVALVHPAASAAVCGVGFREEILVAVGFLGALECMSFPGTGRRGLFGWMLAIAGGVCVAVAVLSKETGAVIPVATAIVWLAARRKGWPEAVGRRVVVRLVAFQTLILAIYLALFFGPLHSLFSEVSEDWPQGAGPIQGVATFAWVHLRYIGLMLWPFGWAGHHPIRLVESVGDLRWVVGGVVLASMGAVGVAGVIRGGWSAIGGLGLLWWGLFLAPVSGVAPLPNPMADRYLYVSLFGFAWVAAWAWWRIRRGVRAAGWLRSGRGGAVRWLSVGAIAVVLLWVHQSVRQVLAHQSEETIWRSTLRSEPDSTRAMHNLGVIYLEGGRNAEAAALLEGIVARDPKAWSDMALLAVAVNRLGRSEEAESWIRRGIEIAPKAVGSHEALIRHYINLAPPDPVGARKALDDARAMGVRNVNPALVAKIEELEKATPGGKP